MENQTIQEKKIYALFQKGEFEKALEIFGETFSTENHPEPSFVMKCFVELNRYKAHNEAFKFLSGIVGWYPKNLEIERAFKLSKKIVYDVLIVKGNSLVEKARQKAQLFSETIDEIDILRRGKIEEENQKIIYSYYEQALEIFLKAHNLDESSLGAISGISRCYKELGKPDKANEYTNLLKRGSMPPTPVDEPEEPSSSTVDNAPSPAQYAEIEMGLARDLFSRRKFKEALATLDRQITADPRDIQALLFKARTHLELHEFQTAESCIDKALLIDQDNSELIQYKSDFLENKLKVLTHGATVFLKKGLKLGRTLGRPFFKKALICLRQAVDIFPGDLAILDQIYTCLVFLGKDTQAKQHLRELRRISPEFITTLEKTRSSSICFLAEFAFADDYAALEDFRKIRRELLLNNPIGQRLVTFYCRLSPHMLFTAKVLGIPPVFMRGILNPVRFFAKFFIGKI